MDQTTNTVAPESTVPVLAAIVLTDSTPSQVKDIYWAKQCTLDMLPNYTDLRFPFKRSSLLCPICMKYLTGTAAEKEEKPKDEEEEPRADGKKSKYPKKPKKPKPWEIKIEELHHEKPEDEAACPIVEIMKRPSGITMLLTLMGQQITWLKAWKTRASQPDADTKASAIEDALHRDSELPKMATLLADEDEKDPEQMF